MGKKQLTKKQWLDLMSYSETEIGDSTNLEDELNKFEPNDIIKAEQIKKIISNLTIDELNGYAFYDGGYNTYEIVDSVKEFEEEQEFLIKLTGLFG